MKDEVREIVDGDMPTVGEGDEVRDDIRKLMADGDNEIIFGHHAQRHSGIDQRVGVVAMRDPQYGHDPAILTIEAGPLVDIGDAFEKRVRESKLGAEEFAVSVVRTLHIYPIVRLPLLTLYESLLLAGIEFNHQTVRISFSFSAYTSSIFLMKRS